MLTAYRAFAEEQPGSAAVSGKAAGGPGQGAASDADQSGGVQRFHLPVLLHRDAYAARVAARVRIRDPVARLPDPSRMARRGRAGGAILPHDERGTAPIRMADDRVDGGRGGAADASAVGAGQL